MRVVPVALFAVLLAACTGAFGEEGSPLQDEYPLTPSPEVAVLGPEPARLYLARIAPMIVGRVLDADELALVSREGGNAIAPILDGWASEEGFVASARTMMELRLSVSGTRDGIDFGLPGNLVDHVVKNERPWSEVLTSDTCYDASDNPIACDTGAPYAAGVLVTRAYMISRQGRFNLTRAGTLMGAFACRQYPLEDELQPRLPKDMLISMFRAESAEEQEDARAAGGFGNGFACYTCHGQFSAHAQPFVKFDSSGHWIADASGAQNPDGQLGESFNGLMASHLIDPARAASEESQMFGMPVANLAEAARVVASDDVFVECAATNLLRYALDLDEAIDIDPAMVHDIAANARRRSADPTFRDIMLSTLGNPLVARTTARQLLGLETPMPPPDPDATSTGETP